jgi:hypothetical protein
LSGSENAWRYGGGRDLSRLEEAAREDLARERAAAEKAAKKADAA